MTMARPWQSLVPAALDDLAATLTERLTGTDPPVKVHDGQWVWAGVEPNVIIVGWSGEFVSGYPAAGPSMSEELGGAAASSENVWEGLGPSLHEKITIRCGAVARVGDTSQLSQLDGKRMISVARARAMGFVHEVAAVIHPPWLGGTVAKAVMGATLTQHVVQNRRGLDAIVGFTIEAEGWAQQ
jgi:hypothetical protein